MSDAPSADEVIARLRSCVDPKRRKAAENYAPTRQESLGLYTADLRTVVREVKRRTKHLDAQAVVRLALEIIGHGVLDGRQCAYEVLAAHRPAMEALTRRDVERLAKGLDNWASVDTFACSISGPAWRTGRLRDDDLRRWTGSRDPWRRRAAVVSTVPLNLRSRGGTGDVRRTLMICRLVLGDDHPTIHKALSWALRTLGDVDRAAVEEFVAEHAARLPVLVKREVATKLRTGRKSG